MAGLAAVGAALVLMVARTYPLTSAINDGNDLLVTRHSWLDPVVAFGSALVVAPLAAIAAAVALVLGALWLLRGRSPGGPRSPGVAAAIAAACAIAALAMAGGASVLGWVAVALLVAATAFWLLGSSPQERTV